MIWIEYPITQFVIIAVLLLIIGLILKVMEMKEMMKEMSKNKRFFNLYDEKGNAVGMVEVIDWWLQHYEGLEHLTEGGTTSPETWYTITAILKRSFLKIKQRKK